jgi:hypothetical protein
MKCLELCIEIYWIAPILEKVMGQAKSRGTFEQRKAEAVTDGRVKRAAQPYRNPAEERTLDDFWFAAMAMILGRRIIKRRFNVGAVGHVDHGES